MDTNQRTFGSMWLGKSSLPFRPNTLIIASMSLSVAPDLLSFPTRDLSTGIELRSNGLISSACMSSGYSTTLVSACPTTILIASWNICEVPWFFIDRPYKKITLCGCFTDLPNKRLVEPNTLDIAPPVTSTAHFSGFTGLTTVAIVPAIFCVMNWDPSMTCDGTLQWQ